MKVRVSEICFFDEKRYYPGDVLELKPKKLLVKNPEAQGMIMKEVSAEAQFSERYMEKLEGSEIKKAVVQASQVPVGKKRREHFKERVTGAAPNEQSQDDDVI